MELGFRHRDLIDHAPVTKGGEVEMKIGEIGSLIELRAREAGNGTNGDLHLELAAPGVAAGLTPGIGYARVSTDDQRDKGVSIETQIGKIKAYAASDEPQYVR